MDRDKFFERDTNAADQCSTFNSVLFDIYLSETARKPTGLGMVSTLHRSSSWCAATAGRCGRGTPVLLGTDADNEDQPWVKTGTYNTLEDVFAAFDLPLCTEYRLRIVQAFRDGAGDVKFSLQDAFETTVA